MKSKLEPGIQPQLFVLTARAWEGVGSRKAETTLVVGRPSLAAGRRRAGACGERIYQEQVRIWYLGHFKSRVKAFFLSKNYKRTILIKIEELGHKLMNKVVFLLLRN